MSQPEFSRTIDVRFLPEAVQRLEASADERAGLARRFDLVAIESLIATLSLDRDKRSVTATGQLEAQIIQRCAVSAEDLAVAISEPLALRFVPANAERQPDEEIELAANDCDEAEYTGTVIDLGEEVAQSMAVAIDPFLTGPMAEEARRRAGIIGESAAGPFAALAALTKRD